MRNLKSHIDSNNMKKLNPNTNQNNDSESKCKCANDKEILQCPVNGKCMFDNVVYSAEVKTKHTTKTYIGMSGRPFIVRWKEHRGNIRHPHQNGTKLSKYVLKQNSDFGEKIGIKDVKWKMKTKTVPYRAGAKFCDTCLSEKTHIALSDPKNILNSRKEIVSKCPHKYDFKLKFYKPP